MLQYGRLFDLWQILIFSIIRAMITRHVTNITFKNVFQFYRCYCESRWTSTRIHSTLPFLHIRLRWYWPSTGEYLANIFILHSISARARVRVCLIQTFFSPHYLLKCRKSLKNQWRMWKHVTVRRGSFSTYITFHFYMRLRRKNTPHNENYNDYRIAKLLSVLNRVVCDAGTLNTWWILGKMVKFLSQNRFYEIGSGS